MSDVSYHYSTERTRREELISEIGHGEIVDSFVVDRGHQNGAEIHSVTDTGIIIITNQNTHKLVTELVARPEQLRRLYSLEGRTPPRRILKKAYAHNFKHYNTV